MSDVLAAVLPSIGALGIFLFVVRMIVTADRRERAAVERSGSDRDPAPEPGPAAAPDGPGQNSGPA